MSIVCGLPDVADGRNWSCRSAPSPPPSTVPEPYVKAADPARRRNQRAAVTDLRRPR
jgi:hypothetical protein